MQRNNNLFTKSGINTDSALYFFDWAEKTARQNAADKADELMKKNHDSVMELQSKLQFLLFSEKNTFFRISEIKIMLEKMLASATPQCKKYYSVADLERDLESFLKNSPNFEPLYGSDIADQLKQELYSKENQVFRAEDIMKKLTSLLALQNSAMYDANDVSNALHQLLLRKQQVAYAGEEIAAELKVLLDPIVMDKSNEIVEDYSKFYTFVFDWDTGNYSSLEQQKCATVQQILLVLLDNIKLNNRGILVDQYFEKIKSDMNQALSNKQELSSSDKDKQTRDMLTHKIAVMNAMIAWLNGEIKLNELQEIAGDNFLYCNQSSIDTNKLVSEIISFNATIDEFNDFKKTQPLINDISQCYNLLADSDKSEMNTAKLNILLAMKYILTHKPFILDENGYPEVDNKLSMDTSATLDQVITSNPSYRQPTRTVSSMFGKGNEIDKFKKRMDAIKLTPTLKPGVV